MARGHGEGLDAKRTTYLSLGKVYWPSGTDNMNYAVVYLLNRTFLLFTHYLTLFTAIGLPLSPIYLDLISYVAR